MVRLGPQAEPTTVVLKSVERRVVFGFVDNTYPALAELGQDLVVADRLAEGFKLAFLFVGKLCWRGRPE